MERKAWSGVALGAIGALVVIGCGEGHIATPPDPPAGLTVGASPDAKSQLGIAYYEISGDLASHTVLGRDEQARVVIRMNGRWQDGTEHMVVEHGGQRANVSMATRVTDGNGFVADVSINGQAAQMTGTIGQPETFRATGSLPAEYKGLFEATGVVGTDLAHNDFVSRPGVAYTWPCFACLAFGAGCVLVTAGCMTCVLWGAPSGWTACLGPCGGTGLCLGTFLANCTGACNQPSCIQPYDSCDPFGGGTRCCMGACAYDPTSSTGYACHQ